MVAAALGTAAGIMPFVADHPDALGAPAGSPAPTEKEVNDFLVLSRPLTGFDNIETWLAREYLQRFRAESAYINPNPFRLVCPFRPTMM